jgi:hypothetical protein
VSIIAQSTSITVEVIELRLSRVEKAVTFYIFFAKLGFSEDLIAPHAARSFCEFTNRPTRSKSTCNY